MTRVFRFKKPASISTAYLRITENEKVKLPQPYAELMLSWIAAYGAAGFDTKLSVAIAALVSNRLCGFSMGSYLVDEASG